MNEKLKPAAEWAKNNVKVVVAVTVLGLTVAFGWAKGCTFSVAPETPAQTAEAAPAAP